jgi:hypothetical protein
METLNSKRVAKSHSSAYMDDKEGGYLVYMRKGWKLWAGSILRRIR